MPSPPRQAINLLYDDDCDDDIDCAITQPILNHWIDLGYAKVWGMASSAPSQLGAPTLRLFRDYYKHSDLFTVGAWTPGCTLNRSSAWNETVINQFSPGDSCADYPSCETSLRRSVVNYAASGGLDHDLTYVITGPLSCEEAFRNSQPDAISPLTGMQMVQRYIKQFVLMNGLIPSGGEYNCSTDAPACIAFFANVTSQNSYPPVYVVPANTGATRVVTSVPVSTLPASNPTGIAFASQGTSSRMDEDALAVEFSVFGSAGWAISSDSQNTVDPNGGSQWSSTQPSGQYHLSLVASPSMFESLLANPWIPQH
jgi:hypothetical protein